MLKTDFQSRCIHRLISDFRVVTDEGIGTSEKRVQKLTWVDEEWEWYNNDGDERKINQKAFMFHFFNWIKYSESFSFPTQSGNNEVNGWMRIMEMAKKYTVASEFYSVDWLNEKKREISSSRGWIRMPLCSERDDEEKIMQFSHIK